ncbi:hypothetical protein [Aeromicrobium sp. IC_218]|uniref:hypothetical protein n=1 Tax=Aeromicrobium sp. IC_218 TaxID=2545468 RepID=UPI0010386FAE|nr:hypothetical protein [Aeromicrobium sp. IC_218]TCJ00839.1 hypothetical protein E0W78_01820 [Aeromicrobium sp. IC_218]
MFSGEYGWPTLAGLLFGRLLDRGGRRDTPYQAYAAAWRVAEREECWDEAILRQELKDGNVPGAYDADDRPELRVYLERWRARVHLREVPRRER